MFPLSRRDTAPKGSVEVSLRVSMTEEVRVCVL
uniref:Uncharacterized protein n=1 Tax=Anguilla anguilla TaxID=7936 RepID=A0A0E9UVW1_ANGAN